MRRLIVTLITLLCIGSVPHRAISQESDRPNIILVITDDQRADTLWSMPALQAVAARGTAFSNAFTSTPLCCPARCSLLKGMYPHEAGVVRNSPPHGGVEYCDMESTLFTALHNAGYRVGVFGKLMNGTPNGYIPPGVDDSVIFEGNGGYYGSIFWDNGTRVVTGSTVYSTDYLLEQAQAFIASTPAEQPYFVYLAFRAPHMPMVAETEDNARFAGLTYSVPSINEDVSDKCHWMAARPPQDLSTMLTRMQKQYRTLQSVDRAIAAITAGLDWSKTVFVYLSDQGYFWGEHRLVEKGLPYDEALRIPLIMIIPGGAANVVNPSMVITNDIANVLKELAGVSVSRIPRRLTSHLYSGTGSIRTSFLIAQYPLLTVDPPPGFIGMRDGQYKLIEWGDGCREFYDLSADPYEMTNQYAASAHTARINAMLSQMRIMRAIMDSYGWSLETYIDPPGLGGRD